MGRLFPFLSLSFVIPKMGILTPTEMMSLNGLPSGREKMLSGVLLPPVFTFPRNTLSGVGWGQVTSLSDRGIV